MISAIIFDFDGTLAKLTLDKQQAKDNIIKIAQKYIDPNVARQMEQVYVVETVYAIEKHCGSSAERFRQEAFQALSELELAGSKGKGVFPYTRGVLTELRHRGMKLGILSRSCRAALRLTFPDVDDYVDAVVTRDGERYVKPHPAHMKHVLALLDVCASDAAYVGDEASDIQTGKVTDMRTIGVLTGSETRENLDAAKADYVIADVREICALL
ncbi:MAG: HAD-IA family hydrolase [Syntrophorhabdales bacterium]|jgi:phosphoglycolate phosphatase